MNVEDRILNVNGQLIDLKKIIIVSTVGSETNWATYTVHFDSGFKLSIYDGELHGNEHAPRMKREDLIEAWKTYIKLHG